MAIGIINREPDERDYPESDERDYPEPVHYVYVHCHTINTLPSLL